ncbi:MAG TPA: fatty acid desaturase [Casimicrobiaceae bacterium]|nr:fatty acid desaturase [Casimicrobiaceae bacterium]
MTYDFLSFAARGLVDLPWWGYVVVTLVLTHITIASVTIYLHRSQAHRGLELHPIASHFFRFWLWLTTGMVTREWVAIHRKHHAKVETVDDPHSPQVRGIRKVLLEGTELYRAEAKNTETLAKYGHGTPDDWIERNVYTGCETLGVAAMLVINFVLFGAIGITIWALQMLWIPVMAAGIINGLGHYSGYRNFACNDASTNIVPWGILIGGEELHNNHHAYASSAKLSSRWYEVDIGWMYIRILQSLGLADVKKIAPQIRVDRSKMVPDLATLQAVITHRYAVATSYARSLKTACASEIAALRAGQRGHIDLPSLRRVKRWLAADASALPAAEHARIERTLAESKVLRQIYAMRQDLAQLWNRSTESSEQLLARLQDWCHRAEVSGIAPLAQFAAQLKRYA